MLLSADPGINMMGLSVIDDSNEFKVLETKLIKNARKFSDDEKEIESIYGSRTVKVLAILETIEALLDKYPDITIIVAEAPFYNALTPMAYASLLEVLTVVRYMIAFKRQLKFKTIEPLLVKKLFTNKGMASKEAMKQFLKIKKEDGSVKLEADVDTLSEHEIDAVAVGFVYYMTNKEQHVQEKGE